MKEQEQLSKIFNDLFDGSPWIDVNVMSTLNDISAKQAATKPFPNFNSIWEVVNHMIRWRETVLRRLHGEIIESPEDNYFSFIRDRSDSAWQQTKLQFAESHTLWQSSIKKLNRKTLYSQEEQQRFSNYELIMGILQHDAYHLGQIQLLKKLVQPM
jgi:uncharacterized damage-inducible protein DinB